MEEIPAPALPELYVRGPHARSQYRKAVLKYTSECGRCQRFRLPSIVYLDEEGYGFEASVEQIINWNNNGGNFFAFNGSVNTVHFKVDTNDGQGLCSYRVANAQ